MEYNTAYYSHHSSAVFYAQCHDIVHVVCEYDVLLARISFEKMFEIEKNASQGFVTVTVCDSDVPVCHTHSPPKRPSLSACPFAFLLPTTSFLFLPPTPPHHAIRCPRSQRIWSVFCHPFPIIFLLIHLNFAKKIQCPLRSLVRPLHLLKTL
jgi:hypothetical protein